MKKNLKINGIVSLSLIALTIVALFLSDVVGEGVAIDCLALALFNGFAMKKMVDNKLAKSGFLIAGIVGAVLLGFGLLLIAADDIIGFTGALSILLAYLAKDIVNGFFNGESELFEDYGTLVCLPVALIVCVTSMIFLSDYALHAALLLINFFMICRFAARTENDEVKLFDYIIMIALGLVNLIVILVLFMDNQYGSVTENFGTVFCLANSLYYVLTMLFFLAANKWFFHFSLFGVLLGGKFPTMVLTIAFYGLSYLLIYYWWIALLVFAVGIGVLALIGNIADKTSYKSSRGGSYTGAGRKVSERSGGADPTYGDLENAIDRCRGYDNLQYTLEYVSRGHYRITISGDILSSDRERAAQRLAETLAREGYDLSQIEIRY